MILIDSLSSTLLTSYWAGRNSLMGLAQRVMEDNSMGKLDGDSGFTFGLNDVTLLSTVRLY